MDNLLKLVENTKEDIKNFSTKEKNPAEVFRIRFLGTKGLIKSLMGEMKNVAAENKKQMGQVLNDLKLMAEKKHEELYGLTDGSEPSIEAQIDLTLPGDALPLGSRHPISIVRNKIISIFQRLGFAVAEGPEIEDDWHNFTALNLPENHPARDMQDTFYVSQNPALDVAYTYQQRPGTGNGERRITHKNYLPGPCLSQ